MVALADPDIRLEGVNLGLLICFPVSIAFISALDGSQSL